MLSSKPIKESEPEKISIDIGTEAELTTSWGPYDFGDEASEGYGM